MLKNIRLGTKFLSASGTADSLGFSAIGFGFGHSQQLVVDGKDGKDGKDGTVVPKLAKIDTRLSTPQVQCILW